MIIKKNSTDITTYFKLIDSTAGTPETGLTITDLDLTYVRRGAAPAAKVDATALAATDSAHGDNKAIEVDGTNMPGLYRVDWPDAAFATGVNSVILCVKATGVDPAFLEVELVNYDPADGVRMGLTALPNAAAEASGGLHTIGTGAGQFAVDGSGAITTVATTTTNTDMITSATVNAQCDAAIETYGLDHLVAAPVTGADVADNSIIACMVSKGAPNADWDGFSNLTDSLEALRDQGDLAWVTATSVTVSDKTGFSLAGDQSGVTIGTVMTLTGHTAQTGDSYAVVTNGTYGLSLLARTAALNTHDGKLDAVDTIADAIKVTTDKLEDTLEDDAGTYRFTTNALEQAPSGGASAAAIADAVWDEVFSGHTTAGTYGKVISNLIEDDGGVYRFTANALEQGPTGGGIWEHDIDSTGTQAVTASEALELLVNARIGKAAYNTTTGIWSIYGLDGTTVLATVPLTGSGNRSTPTIP